MNKSIASIAPTHTIVVLPLCFLVLVFLFVGIMSRTVEAAGSIQPGALTQVVKSGSVDNCALVVKLLKKQNHKLGRELGLIKREIAALRVEMHGVTPSKIFSGIGFILGLCGVAALVVARNKEKMLADLLKEDD